MRIPRFRTDTVVSFTVLLTLGWTIQATTGSLGMAVGLPMLLLGVYWLAHRFEREEVATRKGVHRALDDLIQRGNEVARQLGRGSGPLVDQEERATWGWISEAEEWLRVHAPEETGRFHTQPTEMTTLQVVFDVQRNAAILNVRGRVKRLLEIGARMPI